MQQSLQCRGAKTPWQPSVKICSDEVLIALIAAHDRIAMRDLFVNTLGQARRFRHVRCHVGYPRIRT